MEAVTGSRWSRNRAASLPLLTDGEIGQVAISLTIGSIALALIGVASAWVHPLDGPLPGDSSGKVALIALTGLPILIASIRTPNVFSQHLPWVAWGGTVSLTLDAAFVGPTFAPFVTMSYLWLSLMSHVFLPRSRAHQVVVGIAVLYGIVLATQDNNPAAVTQWCLTVTAVIVTGTLGAALVDSVQSLALNEHELRGAVEHTRADLEVASRRKSAFLASMSHELRTPLNAIIGFTEMLAVGLRGPLNPKQAEYVEDIRASGGHLLDLIGEVLDVEAVETGREALELTPVAVSPLLASCVALFREQAARRGVTVRLLVAPDRPTILADERKVRQVVLNLLANALKHTARGGRVQLQCDLAGDSLRIGVLDTGTGIDAADHEKIFEEFRQGTLRSSETGTGLGLPLSRQLARKHGGDLTVESALGEGSAFWLRLPLEGPVEPPTVIYASPRAPRPPAKVALRVTPRTRTELLGSGALFLLLPIALLSLPRPFASDFYPVQLSLVVLASVVYRAVLQLLPNLAPSTRALHFTLMGAVCITAAAACVGPRLAPFVVMFYVWIGTTAIAYLSTRAAVTMLCVAGAAYAVLLATQTGHTLPFVRWELVMGNVVLAALIMRRLVDRLWEVAEDERIAREEIEGANAELDLAYRHKNAFLANMSHELRTPLNVIIGFAEVLSSEAFGPLTEEQAEYVDEILTSARQLLGLINDVLDLGKLDAGRMERTPQLVVLGELLEPAFDEAAALATVRGVSFRPVVHHRDAIIDADDATVRRAVSALAVSAVFATPEGGECEASADIDEEGVVVYVVDGGRPLSVEDRRDLLEEMVGVDGRDTQQALRLALAGRFASLNGGALTVKAGARVGNQWTLNVPARVLSRS